MGEMPVRPSTDIGPNNQLTHYSGDLLPYLPGFRALFTQLPQVGIQFKQSSIPLNDVGCVTKALIKVEAQTRSDS